MCLPRVQANIAPTAFTQGEGEGEGRGRVGRGGGEKEMSC